MSILQLYKLINEALETDGNLLSLDEKIVSKKALKRKRKLQKKRRAEKKAEKAAQEQTEQNTEETKQDTNDKPEDKVTALVVYDETAGQEEEEHTDLYKQIYEQLAKIFEKYQSDIQQAEEMWKSAGEDKQCPMEAWELFNTALTELQQNTDQVIQNTEELNAAELQALDALCTSLDGYMEKAQKQLLAIKPNLTEDDIKSIEGTGTDLMVVDDQEENPLVDDSKQKKTKLDNKKRRKTNIVTYNDFSKNWKKMITSWKEIGKFFKQLHIDVAWDKFKQLAAHPLNFIDNRIWSFLTSPLAKDFVKVLAYANPLTAMIFNGDLGNFGIKDGLGKIRKKFKDKLEGMKRNPDDYNDRGFPKDTSKYTLKDVKREFYGNSALVDCINTSYNHPKVKIGDKSKLKAYCQQLKQALELRNTEDAKKQLNNIIKCLGRICDYMDWKDHKACNRWWRKFGAKGNTQREEDIIDKKAEKVKSKRTQEQQPKQPEKITKERIDKLTDKELADLGIQKIKQESFIENFNKLLDKAQG